MNTNKRPGRVSKDAKITNGFNQTKIYETDAEAKRRILLEKRRLYRRAYRKAATEKAAEKETVRDEDVKDDAGDADDLKAAQRMLQDLRYAYRNSVGADGKRGKQRLVALMESDAEFKFAVKELLKIEASLMAAQIRKEGSTGQGENQCVFVILKGLETPESVIDIAAGTSGLDIKQIRHAMNPDGSEYGVDR
jgi:hypothetical protein